MGFKEYLQKKQQDKFDKHFEKWLQNNSLNVNALINFKGILDKDLFTKRIQEYQTWSTGNSLLIRYFYQNSGLANGLSYFWSLAPDNVIKKHTGIPMLASSAMANILIGGKFDINTKVYTIDEEGKTTNTVNEAMSAAVKDQIDILFQKTEMRNKLHDQAFIDSWCGHSFLKFNYDLSLSEYPIITVYDLTKARVVKDKGITTAIIFSSWYEWKNRKYRNDEIYTTDNNGDATILNKLYQLEQGQEIEVELSKTPYTANLLPEFHFVGLKGMIAFEKPNKLPNSEFPHSYYGASDYQGATDSFDGMDEIFSEFCNETRSNKTIRYIPNSMVPRDTRGNADPQFMKFVTNYVKTENDQDQGANNTMSIQEINDKTDSLKSKFDKYLCLALNHFGLSPLAIGTTGLEAINASDNSQKERNRVTIETRKARLTNYWIPYLKNMITQLVSFNNWLLKTAGAKQDAVTPVDVDFDNLDITFDFGEYVVENPDSVYTRVASAKQSGIMSIEQAVKEIHPEWTDDQITEEVTKIKFENNIGVDDPTLLQMDETLLDGGTEERGIIK